MESYYIKIKQNQSEIEFSTSDKVEFTQKIQMLMKIAGVMDKIPEAKVSEKQLTADLYNKTTIEKKVSEVEQLTEINVPDEEYVCQKDEKAVAKENVEIVQPTEEQELALLEEIVSQQTSKEEESISQKSDFEKILEKSLKNPKEQVSPNLVGDKNYLNLYNKKKFENISEQLVFTAGYLLMYEGKDAFTLKDINRKIFPLTQIPVNHGDINRARVEGFIRVVPNYADRTALTEYTLSENGEQLYNEIIAGKK